MTNKNSKEYLMHYTDFDGLFGILDKNYLRMTDAFTTNDSSELKYALQFIKELALEKLIKKTNETEIKEINIKIKEAKKSVKK